MRRFVIHIVPLHPACSVPEGIGYACPCLIILDVACESDFQKPSALRNDEAKRIQGENMLNAQQNKNFVCIKDPNIKKPSRSSAVQQLNVWIKKETKAALAQQAKLEQ